MILIAKVGGGRIQHDVILRARNHLSGNDVTMRLYYASFYLDSPSKLIKMRY